MSRTFKHGDSKSGDELIQRFAGRKGRTHMMAQYGKDIDIAKSAVDRAITRLRRLQDGVKEYCQHAAKDILVTEVTTHDTLGCISGSLQYVTCTLCGKELHREHRR